MSSPMSRAVKSQQPAGQAPTATQTVAPQVLQGELIAKADSPLARAKQAEVVASKAAASPLQRMQPGGTSSAPFDLANQFRLPVTADQLEELGRDGSKAAGVTTDKITAKFTTHSFGELGDILYKVQTQANALDTTDLTKSGIIGWIKRKGADVRAVLMKRMQTAQAAFDELEGKMVDQRTMLEVWEKDLEQLDKENYQNYLYLVDVLKKAEAARDAIHATIQGWPAIDPTEDQAFMKGQFLEEALAVLNDAQVKVDTLGRLIMLCENNSPDLKARIRHSETQRRTLTRMIEEVLPMVKREFVKFLQTLEMQKSIQLVDTAREMGDQALRLSADSSRDAALAAAKSANTPIVSTATIEHIRTRMLETVQGVQQIQSDAQKQREEDAVKMKEGRTAFLNQLQQHKAV